MTSPASKYQQSPDGHDLQVNEAHIEEQFIAKLVSLKYTFTKRAAASLFAGRDGKLPSADETPSELENEYELLTWLVIMDPTASS